MRKPVRALFVLAVSAAALVSLTACLPPAGPTSSSQSSAPSSRDELVNEIAQALEDSHEFDGVHVGKLNLTVGWDMNVTVKSEAELTGEQLDLMLRTVGEHVEGSDVATVTFRCERPDSDLNTNLHVAARYADMVDRLTNRDYELPLWRDELVNYARSRATEG